nr:hypothetical protein [Tanacetum cinerariifolium]
MRDEHLSTILETELDEVIKSSVENLVPIPSESEDIFDDTCDVPFCDNSPPLDVLNDRFELFSDFNNDCTLSDDDSFKEIDYVEASPPNSELVSLEEVKDDILCGKHGFLVRSKRLLGYDDKAIEGTAAYWSMSGFFEVADEDGRDEDKL